MKLPLALPHEQEKLKHLSRHLLLSQARWQDQDSTRYPEKGSQALQAVAKLAVSQYQPLLHFLKTVGGYS